MFLEILTFVMLILILVIKYGVVSRTVALAHRLREAEGLLRRREDRLRREQNHRRLSEREEAVLTRRQIALDTELRRTAGELEALRENSAEISAELGGKYQDGPPA